MNAYLKQKETINDIQYICLLYIYFYKYINEHFTPNWMQHLEQINEWT